MSLIVAITVVGYQLSVRLLNIVKIISLRMNIGNIFLNR